VLFRGSGGRRSIFYRLEASLIDGIIENARAVLARYTPFIVRAVKNRAGIALELMVSKDHGVI